ncbi:hypothetical protein DPMN_037761 [Dreissena polymorpha]|uniref:Uncharacterized protein n=1 Tax=Dreissena polymorpha TaxID=45954 RepID=A0A9D4RML2_DREPO|nr:hypothetical protein DPMN_037761 [Dreissena polymorpha]
MSQFSFSLTVCCQNAHAAVTPNPRKQSQLLPGTVDPPLFNERPRCAEYQSGHQRRCVVSKEQRAVPKAINYEVRY